MKPQIIKIGKAEELVLLTRPDYEALVARAKAKAMKRAPREIDEDEGTLRVIARSNAALKKGSEVLLPAAVAEAIIRGENPLRVIREWREMTQEQLADATEIKQSMLSALETSNRKGTTKTWKTLATTLRVPMDVLIK